MPYLLDLEDLPGRLLPRRPAAAARLGLHQPADSAPAAYFNVVWRNLLELTFHDELPEGIWPDGGDRWFAVVDRAAARAGRPVVGRRRHRGRSRPATTSCARRWSTPATSSRDARRATRASWTWGAPAPARTSTPRRSASPASPRSSGSSTAAAGRSAAAPSIVNATGWDAVEGYDVTAAPSMRMVVSLADFDDSRWINLTGVSGHPPRRTTPTRPSSGSRARPPWAVLPRGGRRGGRGHADRWCRRELSP